MFKLSIINDRYAPLAQLDRASGYGPEGQGFESLTACHPETRINQGFPGFAISERISSEQRFREHFVHNIKKSAAAALFYQRIAAAFSCPSAQQCIGNDLARIRVSFGDQM